MPANKQSILYTKRGHKDAERLAERLATTGIPRGMALDARGRFIPLAPRMKGAISIGTQADADKQQKIKRGTI